MKSRIHLKLLMAPLSMLTLFACSPNQFQQVSEYDDVYFTSADRQKAPKVVTKPIGATEDFSQVITLENSSSKSVDQELLSKYTNSAPSETEYYVAGEVEPKVKKANQLNYNDFISDYENEMLATYALPLDWETEWDANYFNNLVYNDFEFRLAWYEQYYVGDDARMDRYINASTGRIANSNFSDFNRSRIIVNSFYPGAYRPRLGVSVGLGFGFGNSFGFGFGNGFYDPFFDPFYDPFLYGSSFGFNRWNRWNRWNRGFGGFGFGGFNSYAYCPPIFSNQYIYRGDIIAARNNRTYTRGGRLQSSSVSSVRSDATNGVAPTRSQRLSSASGTRSTVSRSTIASRSERNSGRVRSTSSSGVTSSRSSRSSSNPTNIVSSRTTRSSRASTDAYRFDESSRSSRSSNVRANATSGRSAMTSRTSRSSSSTSRASNSRSSTNSSRPTFNRSSSSRSTSGSVSRSSTNRSSSSSSRGVSRSSSNRSSSSSSRSSGVRSSSSSSRSGSGSVSRGSSSSSRSGSSSSGRSSSSSSKSSSSSRSGRGN